MPAVVPEHSRLLLEALSGGSTFEVDSHVFSADDDWLMAIGYPQEGDFSTERLEAAIRKAVAQTGASECFVIAPELPERLRGGRTRQRCLLHAGCRLAHAGEAPPPCAARP